MESILKMYVMHCLRSASLRVSESIGKENKSPVASKWSFEIEKYLLKVATAGNQKDIIDMVTNEPKLGEGTITSISYEEHFREQIAKKDTRPLVYSV